MIKHDISSSETRTHVTQTFLQIIIIYKKIITYIRVGQFRIIQNWCDFVFPSI